MSDKVRETSGSDQIAAAKCPSSRLAKPYEGTPPGWNSTKNYRRRNSVSPKRGVVRPVVAGAELNICDVVGAKLNIVETHTNWGRTNASNGKLIWYYIWNVCGLGNCNLQQQSYEGLMTSAKLRGLMTSGISRNVFT